MESTWQKFIEKLRIYRKNKENVPLEELRTKYAKGYKKLISDLHEMSAEILGEFVIGGMKILPEDQPKVGGEIIKAVSAIVEERKQAGVMDRIEKAIFQNDDAEEMLNIAAREIWIPAWYQVYAPYWISKCKRDADGRIQCELLPDFQWDENCQVWVKVEKGAWTFSIMLPPTIELVRREQEEISNEKQRKI